VAVDSGVAKQEFGGVGHVGEKLSLEQFSSLPYLATSCGRQITTAEAQLDRLGISRNIEFSMTFGMVPTLVSGSRMIALVHERLALPWPRPIRQPSGYWNHRYPCSRSTC
jgi:hypothetical protein